MSIKVKDSLLWAVLFILSYILSFYPFNLYFLSPIAFVFLFVFIEKNQKATFIKSLLIFYPFHAFHTFWILHLQVDPGIEKFLVLGLLVLPFYLSLYPALFSLAVKKLKKGNMLMRILFVPSLWVTLEYIKSSTYFGFPWMDLYYSQLNHAYIAALSSISGPYLISFLIVLTGYLLYLIYKTWNKKLIIYTLIFITLTETTGYFTLGLLKKLPKESTGKIKMAILQPNILPRNIYDPLEWLKTRDSLLYLTQKIKNDSVKLIVLSESAIPGYFRYSLRAQRLLKRIHDETGALILFGTQDKRRVGKSYKTFNTAMIFDGDSILDTYDKHHLVPFGEWLPYQYKFPGGLKDLNLGWGDFYPGDIKDIDIMGHKAGILICFESIFPEISRKMVKMGAEVLFVITNDGWFGRSKGPLEHFEMARYRAMETGRYVIRSAKTGVSAIITPWGKVDEKIDLFKKGFIVYEVPLIKAKTIYTGIGDVVVLLSFLIVLVFLVYNNPYTVKERRHS